MLTDNPDLASAETENGKAAMTALLLLARNPSAFVGGSELGVLRRYINIPCELFSDYEILKFGMV
jgi:hypothetical protein